MNFVKNLAQNVSKGSSDNSSKPVEQGNVQTQGNEQKGDFLSKLSGKFNDAAGGGQKAEQKEDGLDKAIDAFQEHVLKAGPQNNESAAEQMKDKQIANAIRSQYKSMSGKEFPVKEKP